MVDKSNWNINPVHKNFQALGSDSTHTAPINYYNFDSIKAFGNAPGQFNVLGTTSSHTTSVFSGYQYIDFGANFITKDFTETLPLVDGLFTGIVSIEETLPLVDIQTTQIKLNFEEVLSLIDSATSSQIFNEFLPLFDSQSTLISKFFEETLPLTDLVEAVSSFSDVHSLTVAILSQTLSDHSLTIASQTFKDDLSSTNVAIIPWRLSPVVSITALPSASVVTPVVMITGYNVTTFVNPVTTITNPFAPTVILGGNTFATNIATQPPAGYVITPDTYFIQWLNASIAGVDSCSLLNFDLQLDRTGGTWSIATQNPIGFGIGSQIPIFGLLGTITGQGKVFTNSQVGYVTKGIFGNRNLHKQLNALAAGNEVLFAYLTNSLLTERATQYFGSYANLARTIGGLAQCNIAWALPGGEIPVIEFTVQEGETALGALSSLASEFGGTLTWDGGVNYMIVPPDRIFGAWIVPDQSVITPAGIQDSNLLDLQTGAFGTGFYGINVVSYFNPGIINLPNTQPQTQFPKVQKVNSTNKQFTSEDPVWDVPLPIDTDEAYIQILVPPSDTSGAGNTNPDFNANPSFIPSRYVTNDPGQWFSIGSPSITNPFSKLIKIGGATGATIPIVRFTSQLLPTNNNSVNAGNFIVSIGCTRNSQQDLFESAVEARNQQVRNLLARLIGSFRYVATYEGTINSFFFGSIPLPGMFGFARVCGQDVQGVIESVSFTYPGILNVQVRQYALVNFVKNFYNVDFTTLTGIS